MTTFFGLASMLWYYLIITLTLTNLHCSVFKVSQLTVGRIEWNTTCRTFSGVYFIMLTELAKRKINDWSKNLCDNLEKLNILLKQIKSKRGSLYNFELQTFAPLLSLYVLCFASLKTCRARLECWNDSDCFFISKICHIIIEGSLVSRIRSIPNFL